MAEVDRIFFSSDMGRPTGRIRAEIQALCYDACPVRAECLAEALETRDEYGVRGGRTPRQRRAIRYGGGAAERICALGGCRRTFTPVGGQRYCCHDCFEVARRAYYQDRDRRAS